MGFQSVLADCGLQRNSNGPMRGGKKREERSICNVAINDNENMSKSMIYAWLSLVKCIDVCESVSLLC